jgi:hypothetical protein
MVNDKGLLTLQKSIGQPFPTCSVPCLTLFSEPNLGLSWCLANFSPVEKCFVQSPFSPTLPV